MEARLSLEPELARLAALHATPADLDELAKCVRQSREAGDWRTYEYWDNRLHRAVAEATANVVLLALFDSLNTIRRTVTWGRLRRFAPGLTRHTTASPSTTGSSARSWTANLAPLPPRCAPTCAPCATISCYQRSWPTEERRA